jgi:hypothetical protein
MNCTIPANPDISGIGVRAAVYLQNGLSFVPAFYALWDGKVEAHELKAVETQSTTILITAFAILVSTIVQARTFVLSGFHASIILSLSWMNNTNTFIFFLLYIHHKSDPDNGEKRIEAQWIDWFHHLCATLRSRQDEAKEDTQSDARAGMYANQRLVTRTYNSTFRSRESHSRSFSARHTTGRKYVNKA